MDMFFSRTLLLVLQIVSAVLMIGLILMQNQSAGLSGVFGGEGGFYRRRRGVEKLVFNLTIASAAVFLLSSFLFLYV
jgi:preprotein translocase subunit SecG